MHTPQTARAKIPMPLRVEQLRRTASVKSTSSLKTSRRWPLGWKPYAKMKDMVRALTTPTRPERPPLRRDSQTDLIPIAYREGGTRSPRQSGDSIDYYLIPMTSATHI